MSQLNGTATINKRCIAAMTAFATDHIPSVNKATLEKFLELVYVNGTHGSLSDKQLIDKMRLMIKHVPDTDVQSLQTLAELLNVYLPLTAQSYCQKNGSILTNAHLSPPQTALHSMLN